ncbi:MULTISPECIES: threonine-phosphate decarboxylase CobD [Halomonadaceae]|uniref:threonine-phosphate decarboxylase n=1 Tax=Vreelandella titanicae TaxID=664683 RepID=A0AAP9NLK9_9GAMM|nr:MULTISPECIES: threonine-phosphate decarboxylase CobD [Halomonas]QKS23971.1 Threonine-phosphate decarboxylase [Halomonas titanicae]CDG54788.1 Threonine-phosphate decarboxylase [Halomonas sp. A3H3]SDI72850.1 L-threonine O-3-phosphate decarboxylase [Halomonas titanicae]
MNTPLLPNAPWPSSPWPSHGGQAETLLAHFGLPTDHRLDDFSANLNPLGPPAWVSDWLAKQLVGLERYPAPNYAAARQAIATHHQLQPEQVLLTNGGAEAIFLAAALHAGKRAAIITPSFGEYARACRAHRLSISEIALPAPHFTLDIDALTAGLNDIDVLFLCRPNNPTATLIDISAMEDLLNYTAVMDCRVVVDEAFIDMVGETLGETSQEASLAPLLARYPHLLLLHSMTKFYTLPGLRLGYLLADATTVQAAQDHQPPWSVNHLAAELVAPLLADDAFARRTQRWLASERSRMAEALAQLGLEVVPSQACFFLIRPSAAQAITSDALFEQLLRRGILVRHTHNFAGLNGDWLRVALRDAPANRRLISVLKHVLENILEKGTA